MKRVAANLRARSRSEDVQPLISFVTEHAYEHGLQIIAIFRTLDIVCQSNHLDQSSITTLVKNLYPVDRVPTLAVCKVVCSLGNGEHKPSPATQNLLLRWIILVYEIIEDPSVLAKLYSVVFNLLDTMGIRLDSLVC